MQKSAQLYKAQRELKMVIIRTRRDTPVRRDLTLHMIYMGLIHRISYAPLNPPEVQIRSKFWALPGVPPREEGSEERRATGREGISKSPCPLWMERRKNRKLRVSSRLSTEHFLIKWKILSLFNSIYDKMDLDKYCHNYDSIIVKYWWQTKRRAES